MTFDADDTITFVNKKCAEILGYTQEEILGTSVFSYTDETNTVLLKKYVGRLRSGKTGHFELVFLRKDKSHAFARMSTSPSMDNQGAFLYGLFLVSDISELKKTDDALKKSEIHYRTLIETSPNGILMIDPDGRIMTANFQASKLLGYKKPGELAGKNLFDYVAPNDLEKVHAKLQHTNERGSVKSTECTLISNENSSFCADLNISITSDSTVTPAAYVCVISDITERRKVERVVRKSEEKHRALVEGISHIIFTTDTKGRYTYISPVIQTVLGYSPDELIGKYFNTLVPTEERQRIGLKLKEARTGKFTPSDFKMIDKAGNIHWVRIMAQSLSENDKLIGFTGLIGDINDWKMTEDALHRVELQYKAVVEEQTDLICRFNTDRMITFVNPAFYRYFHKRSEDILNKDFMSFIPEKSHEIVKKILEEVTLERPVQYQDLEIALPGLDARWHHLSIRAIFNAEGKKIEYQSSSRDITKLKIYFEKSVKLLQELQVQHIELENQAEDLRRTQLALAESRDKYFDLYDLAPISYLTLIDKGEIAEVNLAGAALFGIERNALVSHGFGLFVKPECFEQWEQFFVKLREQGEKQSCTLLLQKKSGSVFPAQLDGNQILNSSGEITVRIAIRDITDIRLAEEAKRESDERFRIVVEQSPIVTSVIDKNGIYTFSEGKGLARLGLKPGQVVGSSIFDVYRDNPAICEAGRKALSGIPQKFMVAVDDLTFKMFYSPLKDMKGEVTSFIEVSIDITDSIVAEETIKNATKKLNMLNKITRHDMINKMTVLSGYLNIVEEDLPASSAFRKQFGKVKTAAETMNRLIIFSRNYQTLGVNPAKWHNLKEIVKTSVATVHPLNVNLNIDIDSVEIFADPLIEKVFENLVDNSIRHGKHVTNIRINFKESDGKGIIVYEDNGAGISRTVKDKLFVPGIGKDSGFGLYLSKEILDYTGIDFRETGEEGKGAKFEIVVPETMYKLTN